MGTQEQRQDYHCFCYQSKMNQHGIDEDERWCESCICLAWSLRVWSFFGNGWESVTTKKQPFILLLKRDVSVTLCGMKAGPQTGERDDQSTTSWKHWLWERRNFEKRNSCDLEKHYLRYRGNRVILVSLIGAAIHCCHCCHCLLSAVFVPLRIGILVSAQQRKQSPLQVRGSYGKGCLLPLRTLEKLTIPCKRE